MKYKPYKMKGHSLPGINQRSEGNTDLPDGRSGSSPLQENSSPLKCPLLAALPMIAKVAGGVSAVAGAAKSMKKE